MTIRVELNPEMEARLVAEARSQGMPLEKLAERLLKEALTASSLPHDVLTVDEFHHML
jgi:predicted HicB family RNase H-like nuclease